MHERIALVTGATAGIGAAVAQGLAHAGVSGSHFVRGKARDSSPASYNEQLQEWLWAASETLLATVPALAREEVLHV